MVTANGLSVLVLIGLISGIASGIFGIGGGVLIVPGLIYLVGFSQHRATGTSLAEAASANRAGRNDRILPLRKC